MTAAVVAPPPVASASAARLTAFCSPAGSEVFHSIVYQPQIWTPDPFDVESIHQEAREAFGRLLNQTARPGQHGRVLLLLGEAGSGKTHLIRAFRNRAHADGSAYCGYLQMNTPAGNYPRYVLANLIDALDQPYHTPGGETSGLSRLALGLLEAVPLVTPEDRQQFRDGYVPNLAERVEEFANLALRETRLAGVDLNLMRALLFLLRDDPLVKSRVLMWLRCEDLAAKDRAMLGDLVPRTREEDALRMVIQLGQMMGAVHGTPLVLCIDQLEDLNTQDAPVDRFRKVIDAAVAVISILPSSVVVLACLEDYFTAHRQHLSKSKLDRVELDPKPIRLTGSRTLDEIEAILGQRLRFLYEEQGVSVDEAAPTFPYTRQHLAPLTVMRTREILTFCYRHREECVRAGRWLAPQPPGPPTKQGAVERQGADDAIVVLPLEQDWNAFRTSFNASVPDDETGLAALLAWAIQACSGELPPDHWFAPDPKGRFVPVEAHRPENAVDRLFVAVCDKGTQGGGLGRQITEAEKLAGDAPVAVVRSTAFPSNPRAEVVKQIGRLLCRNGRRVVVENGEWRAMIALRAFQQRQSSGAGFADWQRASKPLSQLHALRQILALDRLIAARTGAGKPPQGDKPEQRTQPATSEVALKPSEPAASASSEVGPLRIGVTRGVSAAAVEMRPEELKQHAAFLGGSGSGKTTAALNLIEQLLLRGVPAVLLDRKGDLCNYAVPDAWEASTGGPEQAACRRRLRDRVAVAVFTPGEPAGRPLTIPVVPEGLDEATTAEREQLAGYAAAALGGMMGYKPKGPDQSRLAVLRKAIEVLAAVGGRLVTVPALRQLVQDRDGALLSAVGGFDDKVYKKLGDELLTLWLQHKTLLEGGDERLDIDALLGRGPHARPGRTQLSVISTRFLGDAATVDFWVAQLLVQLSRWIGRRPAGDLQAVFLFDEADQYLPAQRQPATKAPMENLLKRARLAGVGLLLATQSPGDFDYKCRDTIRTWVVGKVKEQTALNKLKPMFSDAPGDVSAKLPTQAVGQFYLMRDKEVVSIQTTPSLMTTEQLPEDRILAVARASKKEAGI